MEEAERGRKRERDIKREKEREREGGGRVEGAIKPACPPCSFATFIVAFLICMQRDLDGAPVGLSVVSADSVVRENTHTFTHPAKHKQTHTNHHTPSCQSQRNSTLAQRWSNPTQTLPKPAGLNPK